MGRAAAGTVDYHGTPPRWWARVTTRDEQGKIRRPWVDLERPDLKNTPEDKKIAKRLALRRAKAATKKTFVGVDRATAPKVTPSDLEDKWFKLIEQDAKLSDSTVESYESCWRANIVGTVGKRPVAELTPPVLRAWIAGFDKSPSTIRNNANTLSRFFDDAIAERWIPLTSNPMRNDCVRGALPRVETKDAENIVHHPRQALETLLRHPGLPHERFGRWLLDITGGERDGELQGLQFKQQRIDEKEGIPYLHVAQQVKTARGSRPLRLGPPKRNSKRKIPLHPAAAVWLDWWKAEGGPRSSVASQPAKTSSSPPTTGACVGQTVRSYCERTSSRPVSPITS
jgi:hypothetical protein